MNNDGVFLRYKPSNNEWELRHSGLLINGSSSSSNNGGYLLSNVVPWMILTITSLEGVSVGCLDLI